MASVIARTLTETYPGGALRLTEDRPRSYGGWRAGRPVEDPAKTKGWGFVTAKPSEFLIHCRRGRVLPSSGQGATCFKWPWDSVAIVPTSLQQVHFLADQVTRERVGVGVTGLAVYRIVEPLFAFRVLNFSYPERAQEKLEGVLTEMLIGATRRLVANLSVDECLEKRKAALADELLREIAPVLGGEGRPDDGTDRGWGVVLDTVEIQEVRVLSESVFAAMQAPFRAALERRAREARAAGETASALSEAASRRDIHQADIDAEASVRARRAEAEAEELERQNRAALRAMALALTEEEARAGDAERRRELALAAERARAEDAVQRHELAAGEARAEIEAHELVRQAGALRAELERAEWSSYLDRKRSEAEIDALIGRGQAEVALAQATAEKERAAARARILTAEKLPELAGAVGQRIGELKVTQIGGDAAPLSQVAQAVYSILELARRD